MKYYDKMHYEEELDLFCRCIRANISIMLHKTIYEINSTLLLRTHFKPPSSVCNNFILRSHVEFGCLPLLKYAFYSLLYRCKNEHFRCKLNIHLKKITYKPYPIVIVCLLFYIIYSAVVMFISAVLYVLAETQVVCDVTQPSLRSEVAMYTFQV